MVSRKSMAEDEILNHLINGLEPDRLEIQRRLEDPSLRIDCARLRFLILSNLTNEWYAGRENEENDIEVAWTRAWLLSALGRISEDDREALATLKKHTNPNYEKFWSARFWSLEGLYFAKVADIKDIANRMTGDDEGKVAMLATAILAQNGDSGRRQELINQLNSDDGSNREAVLQALLVIPFRETAGKLFGLLESVKQPMDASHVIDALGRLPRGTRQAEVAGQQLIEFIVKNRRDSNWDVARAKAIRALGKLKAKNAAAASVLVEELTNYNPMIVSEAAKSLANTLDIPMSIARVVEAASLTDPSRTREYANALRWMEHSPVVDALEHEILSGPIDRQEIARTLLVEVGGSLAFKKLQTRTNTIEHYTSVLDKTETRIRELFESSLQEARGGFKVATRMDMTVFIVGILLICVSAGLILLDTGDLRTWVGLGAGGVGVMGVLYSTLIAKPRQQVREAVDHLMYLKVVFLAYIRQLHQTDQAFTHRMIDEDTVKSEELDKFALTVQRIMENATARIDIVKKNDKGISDDLRKQFDQSKRM